MGTSILVKPGRIEASLARATAHQGTVKGRLNVAAAGARTDVRLQGSFERVDVGGFLGDVGQTRWMVGTGQGQVSLEGVGESPADLLRQVHGRAAILVRPGELVGVGLSDVLKRVERRPLSASLDWRGGRTAFDQALLTLNVASGVGDVIEGSLASPLARASLQGRISLVDRMVAMRANVDGAGAPAAPGSGIVFDITGPWDDVAVVPDARALIQRSGAAQPLLGPGSGGPATRGAGLEGSRE
jgi:AsmA protein